MKVLCEFVPEGIVLFVPELNVRFNEDSIIAGMFRGTNVWFYEQLIGIYDQSRYNFNLLFSDSSLESNIPRPTADYIIARARREGRAGG